jgi:hypothetical protein
MQQTPKRMRDLGELAVDLPGAFLDEIFLLENIMLLRKITSTYF